MYEEISERYFSVFESFDLIMQYSFSHIFCFSISSVILFTFSCFKMVVSLIVRELSSVLIFFATAEIDLDKFSQYVVQKSF